MKKSELMEHVGFYVLAEFKDGTKELGLLEYLSAFSASNGWRKPNLFYLNNTGFRASNVKKIKIDKETGRWQGGKG